MLFWMFVIIFVIGCIVLIINNDIAEMFAAALMTIALGGMFIGGIVMVCNFTGLDGTVASMKSRYETLVYQYENDIYENDLDYGKRDLIKDIQEWNENLTRKQANQRDFWIGVFIPNIYDQFEFIELEG